MYMNSIGSVSPILDKSINHALKINHPLLRNNPGAHKEARWQNSGDVFLAVV